MLANGKIMGVFPLWAVIDAVETGSLVARPISKKGVSLTWKAQFLKTNNMPVHHKEFIRMMQKKNVVDTLSVVMEKFSSDTMAFFMHPSIC